MDCCGASDSSHDKAMKLLIIKPSSLGDIIHGLQVAHTIRAQLPEVQIDWVARDIFAPLVEACPVVDRVLCFRRKEGIGAFVRLLREIRLTRYDWVLDFQGLARSGLMTLASRSPRKLGRSDAREGARLAYHETAPLPEGDRPRHAVEILLQFCPLLGLRPELAGPIPLRIDRKELESLLEPHYLQGQSVVLFPGSRRPEKEWKGFAELTRLLLKRMAHVRVIWSGSEPVASAGIEGSRFVNLTGRTSLQAVISLVAEAGVVVANDSGPMHLAAALGRPTLAVFGPTDPERYGPFPLQDPAHIVVQAPNGNLEALSAEDVYAALSRLLGRSPELFEGRR
jgi:heptosyltransferase I